MMNDSSSDPRQVNEMNCQVTYLESLPPLVNIGGNDACGRRGVHRGDHEDIPLAELGCYGSEGLKVGRVHGTDKCFGR